MTFGLLLALALEKFVSAFNVYDHVKKLHCGVGSCCFFDVERSNSSQVVDHVMHRSPRMDPFEMKIPETSLND